MFSDGTDTMNGVIRRIEKAETIYDLEAAIRSARVFLKDMGIDRNRLMELEQRGYVPNNEFSEKDTDEKLQGAKKRVINFMEAVMEEKTPDTVIYQVLENFYLFWENLVERTPHKSGGIQGEQLQLLKIKNEYDVQHILYAYLKPLYPFARIEVNEDTGFTSVRKDIIIDEQNVIEIKCTRPNLTAKSLLEQIEADIVHYQAKNIYFFIYDKEKLIHDPVNFKKTYEKKIGDKNIMVILHQSKNL